MSNVDALLSRLERVKQTKPDCWLACCPAHDDRNASLSIRETSEGSILIHCFAGCSCADVIDAAGLTMDHLFPKRLKHVCKPERRPFPATDVLRALGFESLVVAATAVSILAGHPISEIDRERLMLAVSRIQSALNAAGVSND